MTDEERVDEIAGLIAAGNRPYADADTTVILNVGDERVPIGVVLDAYVRIAQEVAENADEALARNRHPWSLTVQNIALMVSILIAAMLVLGFGLVLFRGWP